MLINELREISPGIKENEPMSLHTTFKIGGAADLFASVAAETELISLVKLARREGIPFMIMGNGSNMLVGDGGIRGLVIQIGSSFSECEINGTEIDAKAGVLMSKIAALAARASLTGFEPMSGIPGTLGGGIFMNAGAYGGEMSQVVKSVKYIDRDGNIHTADTSECGFGYRKSIFSSGDKYIISARLSLRQGNEDDIRDAMADYNKRRSDKQPLSYPSAGSTFKRPEGHFAGKLIQDAGLMGYSIGGAQVSEKHAGFVINTGGATASDVLALIEHIQKTVMDKFGIMLEPEIRLTGE